MNKNILLALGVGIAILIIVGIMLGTRSGAPLPDSGTVLPPGSPSAPSAGGTISPTSPSSPQSGGTTAGKTGLAVTAPVSGAKLILNKDNVIRWNKEAGFTGGIVLFNAKTKTEAGWITGNIGPHQTNFTWDTLHVFLSRASSLRKEVGAGDYYVRIIFDVKNIPAIESGVFSVIYPSQVTAPEHRITLQNYLFEPKTITVTRGEKIVFENKDTIEYKFIMTGIGSQTIQPGGEYLIDSNILFPGVYDFYSEAYPSMSGKLTVR